MLARPGSSSIGRRRRRLRRSGCGRQRCGLRLEREEDAASGAPLIHDVEGDHLECRLGFGVIGGDLFPDGGII